jgi:hypothetical protein
LDLISEDIVEQIKVKGLVFNNQCEDKINGLRNRLAEGGHSEAGEEVWSGQPLRRGFESAVSFVAKSKEATATEGGRYHRGFVNFKRFQIRKKNESSDIQL